MTRLPFGVSASLEVISGKYANIESSSKGNHLVVKTSQPHGSSLTVYKVLQIDKSILMAFCFKLGENRHYIAVDKDSNNEVSVRVEGPIDKPFDQFPKMYLFRLDTNGEYGSLCSAVAPEQYLSVSENKEIILSSKQEFSFKINLNTHEVRETLRILNPMDPIIIALSLIPDLSQAAH